MTLSLSTLRELADKASPGPYTVRHEGLGVTVRRHDGKLPVAEMWHVDETSHHANGAYFASLDPTTVLTLIRVAEAARTLMEHAFVFETDNKLPGQPVVGVALNHAEALRESLKDIQG